MTTPARQFTNDDEAAQHWLTVLRDGGADQKIQAREQLAAIFERRGMLEEATDLLVANVHDGVKTADTFRWLARLYQGQGQEVLAMQAAAEAAKYLPPTRQVVEPATVASAVERAEYFQDGPTSRPPPTAPQRYAAEPAPKRRGGVLRTMTIGCLGCTGLLALLAVAAVVLAGLGAPSATGAVKPGAEPTAVPRIGDVVERGNWAYQVTGAERQREVVWSQFGNKTEAKGVWQIVRIRLKNISRQSYPIHAHDFELRDGAGVTYKPDVMTSGMVSRHLKLSALGEQFPPGVDAETVLLADVNPDANGLRLWLVQARTSVDLAPR